MKFTGSAYLALGLLAAPCFAQAPQGAPAQQAKPANSAFRALVSEANAHIRHVDATELGHMIANHAAFVLIDVRETEEWTNGHAAGALHIGRGVLEPRIEATVGDKDKRIVLYCAGGNRSALAAESLQRMGYTNVWSLDGGFGAYKAAGLPVE